MSQVAADLRAAAEVLRRDGWTRGTYHQKITEGTYCHCAVGAIEAGTGYWSGGDEVAFGTWLGERAYAAWGAFAAFIGGQDRNAAFDWNDAPGRTADEVIAALEAAAAAVEAQP